MHLIGIQYGEYRPARHERIRTIMAPRSRAMRLFLIISVEKYYPIWHQWNN